MVLAQLPNEDNDQQQFVSACPTYPNPADRDVMGLKLPTESTAQIGWIFRPVACVERSYLSNCIDSIEVGNKQQVDRYLS